MVSAAVTQNDDSNNADDIIYNSLRSFLLWNSSVAWCSLW
jgi:hypothetical protein